MIKVGLFGYGKAGAAVAHILKADPRFALCWIAKRSSSQAEQTIEGQPVPVVGLDTTDLSDWLDKHPVDAFVDFSAPESLMLYGEELRRRKIMRRRTSRLCAQSGARHASSLLAKHHLGHQLPDHGGQTAQEHCAICRC